MNLTSAQRRYLQIYQSLVPCVITVIVCGVIGVLDYRGRSTLPVWGLPQSMALDLTVTAFLLPFITCLIATPLVRRDVRLGVVAGLTDNSRRPRWLRSFDAPLIVRAACCGLAGLLVVGSIALPILSLVPLTEATVPTFLVCKLLFAGLYSAIITPQIAWLAMSDR